MWLAGIQFVALHMHTHAQVAHTSYCVLKWPGERGTAGSPVWVRATVLSRSLQTKQHNSCTSEGPE